ncbi:iron-sulfur cluster assembly scaffold protein [Lyticum sinuosum]|uniref:NifU-like protein n=1 Tax=Lyticum sinuosum TaxID=1332059 RepID=A0AAE5AHV1_9RICK|nr:iron-sulfur cluster assembly scaffold protein [Lyticum sinuosum]MDZ5761598.1 NifU-like protein [Lyticum sinuosum]
MPYNEKIINTFDNPKNIGSLDSSRSDVGTGIVGAPSCGDVMKLQILVNDQGIIEKAVVKTFGCVSAIASSSYLASKIEGMSVNNAKMINNQQIADELGLPPVKIHCSVLAAEAISAAIDDIQNKKIESKA